MINDFILVTIFILLGMVVVIGILIPIYAPACLACVGSAVFTYILINSFKFKNNGNNLREGVRSGEERRVPR